MRNYLNILLVIIVLFTVSCSDNSTNKSSDSSNSRYGTSSGLKDSYIYNSLYIHIALKRSLEIEALSKFVENINIVDDIGLFEKISRISLDKYLYKEAEIIAKRWLELRPSSYEPHQFSLRVFLDANKMNKAENIFNRYIRVLKPVSKNDYSKLIYSLSDNKNRLNIIKFLDNYLSKTDNRELNLSYIELLYLYNMPYKAIMRIEEIDTLQERSLVRLHSRSHMMIGSYEEAIKILETYLNGKPNSDRPVQFELLESYLAIGDINKSSELIGKILQTSSDESNTIFQISRLLTEYEKYSLSEKYLLSIVNSSDQINFLRGVNDFKRNNFKESIKHFERIDNFNMKIMGQLNIAMCIEKINSTEKAIKYLLDRESEASEFIVKQQFILKAISILNDSKLYKKIISLTTDRLKSYPLNPDLLYARAMAYESIDDIQMMEDDLKLILASDRKNPNTLNALGYSLAIHTNRYKVAYDYIYEAYQYDPGNPAILDSMAWILFKRGKFVDALKYAEASYMLDQDPEIVEHYCEILIKNKRYKVLRGVIDIEIKNNPDDSLFIKKMKLYKDAIPL